VCLSLCAQLLYSYTTQHRAVLIIFPLNIQTIIIALMLSTGGEKGPQLNYAANMEQHPCLSKLVKKVKGFPYSLPSVGPGADPSVQAVSSQVTISHPPGGRLPLLSTRPAVTFPVADHHRPMASTKLCCLVTEAHRFEQLAQGCYAALSRAGFEPTICWSQVQHSTHCATTPPLKNLHLH